MQLKIKILATMAATAFLIPSLRAESKTHQQKDKPARKAALMHGRSLKRSVPRTELFLGYSYLRALPTYATGNRLVMLNGGSANVAFNVNRYFGFVTDFGGFNDTQLQLNGPGANPVRLASSKGDAFSFLFGPRLSFRQHERFTPFLQVLAGGIHASEVTLTNCTSACQPLPAQSSFAMTAGGGLDLKLSQHIALRLVQAEYLMTRFADPTSNITTTQNDMRLSGGVVFRFGGREHVREVNHPPVVSCQADGKSVLMGSTNGIAVHAVASDEDGDPLTYAWTASGGAVAGDGPQVNWSPAGASPGIYTVSVLVSDGRGGDAACSSNVRVEMPVNQPPTLTCSVDQQTMVSGNLLHITAVASDPDNDPLTLMWETTGGLIQGSGIKIAIDTTGLPTTHLTIHGHVSDGRGGVADCTVGADTVAALPPGLDLIRKRLALHSIYFATAKPTAEQPDRGIVPSQQQTLLALASDFSRYLESVPSARLILEGHADPRASEAYNNALSQRRVESTQRFLTEHGVPGSSIEIKALGDDSNLTEVQVRDAVERTPELSSSQRMEILSHIETVLLASNRRVDVSLSDSGQKSSREYPFNASDSMVLLQQKQAGKAVSQKARKALRP